MKFEPDDYNFIAMTEAVSRLTFFAEKRDPFLRYDGKTLSDRLPTLPPKLEHYFATLRESGDVTTKEDFDRRINEDRQRGLFEIEGDKWYKLSSEIPAGVYDVFNNLNLIMRDGCLPPPNSIINNEKKTVLAQNVKLEEESKRMEENAKKYSAVRAR